MNSLFYGFWDYWELRHKVTFDGINRLIIINQGVTNLDVQSDIYSAWKEWSLLEVNTKYLQALDTVGGEPTVAGQFLDVTYFLINGWRIKPYSGEYTLNIIGNLFEVDGGQIFVPANKLENIDNNININTNTSVIVRKVEGGGTNGDLSEISDKIDDQSSLLVSIENRTIQIQSTNSQILDKLSNPIEANISSDQMDKINEILGKVEEIWKINGLSNEELTVSQSERVVGDIKQIFTKTGESVTINRE